MKIVGKNLKIELPQNKIDEHRQNWINHLDGMANEVILKQIVQYKSKERR
jgi:hypothetical protein